MKRRRIILLTILAVSGLAGTAIYAAVSPRARLLAPSPTTLLVDRQGRYLADVGDGGGGLGYWPLDQVPERIALATIAIEDQRFWTHPGVDLLAIARALRQNTAHDRRISGASTLAMQIARMQQPEERTYTNKLLEAATALLLTWRYGREEILRHYLRVAPYSNRIHGISLAAEKYFAKSIHGLSWAEIVFLAAIPQSPSRMNPHDWRGWGRAKKRAGQILALLEERGVLSPEEDGLARAQLQQIMVQPKRERNIRALHFALRMESSGDLPVRGGIVRTTLDLDLQDEVLAATNDAVSSAKDAGADQAAVLVVDRKSGGVLAYAGSTSYFDGGGAIDFARTPRAAGSTLKPFFYAAALDQQLITPATVLDDLSRGPSNITNMDHNYLGPMLPRAALANSRNVPAAYLLEELGLERGYELLGELGLHHREKNAGYYGAGLALGSLPVTLENLAAAYLALAEDGIYRPLSYGTATHEAPRRIFSEASARQLALFLSDPVARLPTFPRLGPLEYDFPAAVKTGTSQGHRDAWTIVYTREILVAAWLGRTDAQPMQSVTGASAAAKLAKQIILPLHQNLRGGFHDRGFPPPAGTEPVRLCALSGQRAGPDCDHSFVEHLRSTAALESCEVHRREGDRTFVELPPKYARWVAEQYFRTGTSGPRAVSEFIAPPVIVKPENGARILIDPETPLDAATLALEVRVDRSVEQILWYVDGKPLELAAAPFSIRWPLARGAHVLEARVPFTPHRSSPIRITVE